MAKNTGIWFLGRLYRSVKICFILINTKFQMLINQVEAINGDMLPQPREIIHANIVTVIGIYVALRLEDALESIDYRPALKESILIIFQLALFTYVAFTFNTPEHFFETPKGGMVNEYSLAC